MIDLRALLERGVIPYTVVVPRVSLKDFVIGNLEAIMRFVCVGLIFILVFAFTVTSGQHGLNQHVDPLIGTDDMGHTYPGATVQGNVYVDEVWLNGELLEWNYITHEEVVCGGELRFVMSDRVNRERGTGAEAKPYSMSR